MCDVCVCAYLYINIHQYLKKLFRDIQEEPTEVVTAHNASYYIHCEVRYDLESKSKIKAPQGQRPGKIPDKHWQARVRSDQGL